MRWAGASTGELAGRPGARRGAVAGGADAQRPPAPRLAPCASCGATHALDGVRLTPYCSLGCKAVAKAVRYARRAYRVHGRPLPDDVEYAVRIKVAHALGGGYHEVARRLSSPKRQPVWERDGGRCVLCAQPGEEIDHVAGDSPDLGNLRLLCRACHREVTEARLVPVTDPERLALRAQIMLRVPISPTPPTL